VANFFKRDSACSVYSDPLKILTLRQRKLLKVLHARQAQIAQLLPIEGTPKGALTGELKRSEGSSEVMRILQAGLRQNAYTHPVIGIWSRGWY
jgi:hypothetical protein